MAVGRVWRVFGACAGLGVVGLLGISSAGALADNQGAATSTGTTALRAATTFPRPRVPVPPPNRTATTVTRPVPLLRLPTPVQTPPPVHHRARASAPSAPARTQAVFVGSAEPAPHRHVARRSSVKPTSSPERPSSKAVGAPGTTMAEGPLRSSGTSKTTLLLFFVALGLAIASFALTPRWALERTRLLKPVVEQRPHVFMAGATIVFLSVFGYVLGHWSP
jgi:hypothetical protein